MNNELPIKLKSCPFLTLYTEQKFNTKNVRVPWPEKNIFVDIIPEGQNRYFVAKIEHFIAYLDLQSISTIHRTNHNYPKEHFQEGKEKTIYNLYTLTIDISNVCNLQVISQAIYFHNINHIYQYSIPNITASIENDFLNTVQRNVNIQGFINPTIVNC